jgi:hypothetical protein
VEKMRALALTSELAMQHTGPREAKAATTALNNAIESPTYAAAA